LLLSSSVWPSISARAAELLGAGSRASLLAGLAGVAGLLLTAE